MTKLSARHATVKFSTAAITFDTSTALDAESWPSTLTQVKDVTLAIPEGAVEKVDFLGETSGFQNAIYDEKPFTVAKFTGTLMMTGDEQLEALFAGGGTAISGGWTRRTYGDSTTAKTRVIIGAIMLNLDNGSEEYTAVLNNVYVTKFERKPTGSDGYFDVDFECECLPVDFTDEFKD